MAEIVASVSKWLNFGDPPNLSLFNSFCLYKVCQRAVQSHPYLLQTFQQLYRFKHQPSQIIDRNMSLICITNVLHFFMRVSHHYKIVPLIFSRCTHTDDGPRFCSIFDGANDELYCKRGADVMHLCCVYLLFLHRYGLVYYASVIQSAMHAHNSILSNLIQWH